MLLIWRLDPARYIVDRNLFLTFLSHAILVPVSFDIIITRCIILTYIAVACDLVRYNILLVFALLMLQGITIAFWDALFNRQILESAADWCWDDGAFIHTDKELLIVFFTITFFT